MPVCKTGVFPITPLSQEERASVEAVRFARRGSKPVPSPSFGLSLQLVLPVGVEPTSLATTGSKPAAFSSFAREACHALSMDRAREFCEAVTSSLLCDPAVLDRPGVSVKGHPARAESRVTAGYQFDKHFVITCDPAAEAMLRAATVDMEPTLNAWHEVSVSHGGELLGAGKMKLLESTEVSRPGLPSGFVCQSLTPTDPNSLAAIAALVDDCSDDDLEEAELEIDDLDEVIEVVLAPSGAIAAYGSSRDFDLADGFGDIGVITHPNHRGEGLGTAVVQSLIHRQRVDRIEPLYRCDPNNIGSMKLSARLGFVPVIDLLAYRFTV